MCRIKSGGSLWKRSPCHSVGVGGARWACLPGLLLASVGNSAHMANLMVERLP